jgi:hypothetical protein
MGRLHLLWQPRSASLDQGGASFLPSSCGQPPEVPRLQVTGSLRTTHASFPAADLLRRMSGRGVDPVEIDQTLPNLESCCRESQKGEEP